MRKVIEFIPCLQDGGAETLVKDYALYIDKNLYCLKIITIYEVPHTANTKILKQNNIEIISVYKKWSLFIRLFNKVFGKKYISYRLKKIIKKEVPNVIHVHLDLLKYLKPISNKL